MQPSSFTERRGEHARIFSFEAHEPDERDEIKDPASGANTYAPPSRGDLGMWMALRVALVAGIFACIAARGESWGAAAAAFATCVVAVAVVVRPYLPSVVGRRGSRIEVRVERAPTLVRVDGTREDLASGGGNAALAEVLNAAVRAIRAARGGYR